MALKSITLVRTMVIIMASWRKIPEIRACSRCSQANLLTHEVAVGCDNVYDDTWSCTWHVLAPLVLCLSCVGTSGHMLGI